MTTPIFDVEYTIADLISRFMKFGSIVIAVDFDDTLFDFYKRGIDFTPVHDLIKEAKALGNKIVIYTARNEKFFCDIEKYCKEVGIEYDAINKDVLELTNPTCGKIYYNILLDDKAGLGQAFFILKETIKRIKEKNRC